MRDFVKLSPTFWTGRTGRALREAHPSAQLLALYLISSPHVNYIGIYRLPLTYIAADLGWTIEHVHDIFENVKWSGFAEYDRVSEIVWITEAAKWQIGDELKTGDKRIGAVQREFESLPTDCLYLDDFFTKYADAYKLKARKGMTAPTATPTTNVAPAPYAAPATKAVPVAGDTAIQHSIGAASSIEIALEKFLEVRESICPDKDCTAAEKMMQRVLGFAEKAGRGTAIHMLNLAANNFDYDLVQASKWEAQAETAFEI